MKTEAACAIVHLHPGSVGRVREWVAHITAHKNEALQTLAAEGVQIESVFLASSEQGDFLVYYMRSHSQEVAQSVAEKSLAAIDAYHRAFKRDCWARVERLEPLIDLQQAAPSPSAESDAGLRR